MESSPLRRTPPYRALCKRRGVNATRLTYDDMAVRPTRLTIIARSRGGSASGRVSSSCLLSMQSGVLPSRLPTGELTRIGVVLKDRKGPEIRAFSEVAGARFVSRYHRTRIRETTRHPN
jgi:hypothetical protein